MSSLTSLHASARRYALLHSAVALRWISSSSAHRAPGVGVGNRRFAAEQQRRSASPAMEWKARKGDPPFREVWRKFQLRVHPDLFSLFPELMAKNQESLQKLQGVLNEAKSGEKTLEDFIKPRSEQLEFFVRTDVEASFLRVALTLRLPGGHCPDSLAEAISPLFAACKLPHRFHWGREYWGSTYSLNEEQAAAAAAAEEGEEAGGESAEQQQGHSYYNPRRQQKKWQG